MSARDVLTRFNADADYFNRRRKELRHRYADQWVAVYQKRVAGSAPDRDQLKEQLLSHGIPPGLAYREHLGDERDVFGTGGSAT